MARDSYKTKERLDGNIKTDYREDVKWVQLPVDKFQRRSLVMLEMNILVPGHVMTSSTFCILLD
jgi:hypothetical protein